MRLSQRIRDTALTARAVTMAASFFAVAAFSGCGGSDGCGGFISINASPADCERRAEELGCEGFETDGPTCGLLGCVRCEGDD